MVLTDLLAELVSTRFLPCKGLLSPFGINKQYGGLSLEAVSISCPPPTNHRLGWFLPKSIFTLLEPNGFLTPFFLDDSDLMIRQHPLMINEFISTMMAVGWWSYKPIIPSSLISWHSSIRKSFPSLPPCSFLSFFFLCFIFIRVNSRTLFLFDMSSSIAVLVQGSVSAQVVPELAALVSSSWLLPAFGVSPSFFGHLSTFCQNLMFQAHLVSFLFQPWNHPFPQIALLPLTGEWYKPRSVCFLGLLLSGCLRSWALSAERTRNPHSFVFW